MAEYDTGALYNTLSSANICPGLMMPFRCPSFTISTRPSCTTETKRKKHTTPQPQHHNTVVLFQWAEPTECKANVIRTVDSHWNIPLANDHVTDFVRGLCELPQELIHTNPVAQFQYAPYHHSANPALLSFHGAAYSPWTFDRGGSRSM